MTETLTTLLQWLIPAGGFGTVIVWLTSKNLRNVRTAKEVHETYKVLYENIQQTLIELQDENKKMYKVVARLERAVNRASVCRYYDHCPVRDELQKSGQAGRVRPARRQPAKCPQGRNPPEAGAAEHGEDCLSDGLAEGDTGGDGIQ